MNVLKSAGNVYTDFIVAVSLHSLNAEAYTPKATHAMSCHIPRYIADQEDEEDALRDGVAVEARRNMLLRVPREPGSHPPAFTFGVSGFGVRV